MDRASEAHNKGIELSGEQILARCAQTYLAISEYVGQCVVNSHTTGSNNEAPPESLSRTAQAYFDFKRNAHFNIQGRKTNDTPFSIESNPTKTILKYQVKGQEHTEELEDLIMAVAGMTGVAAGAPTTIPALLLEAKWGFPFRSGPVPYLKGHETLEGHDCFIVIQSSDEPAEVHTYWIDSQSFLLRKMREERGEECEDQVNARREQLRKLGLPDSGYKLIKADEVRVFSIETVVFGAT